MAKGRSLSDFFGKTGTYVRMTPMEQTKVQKKNSSAGQKGKNSK